MNAGLFLGLLFLFSSCHGRVQDDSPSPDISVKTKEQRQYTTLPPAFCPDASDIVPCTCFPNEGDPIVNCSTVQDEVELRRVFSGEFPTTNLFKFEMLDNKGVKVLEDGVFGDVSFKLLEIKNSVLETVMNDALTPSLRTLYDIQISNSQLSTFPFEKLAEFTALRNLIIDINKIQSLPPLASSFLWTLNLNNNTISNISDVFTQLEDIRTISLSGNQLTEIPAGPFIGLHELNEIFLSGNNITTLRSLAFDLEHAAADIYLSHNIIDTVEVDAFKGVQGATVYLSYNALTTLEEEVWRSVLEKPITIDLEGNDLTCGCDVAWLVGDSQLLEHIIKGRCADGRSLTDLDPADFVNCTLITADREM